MKVYRVDFSNMQLWVKAKPDCGIKGLRASLQKTYHEVGIYGLEFWINHECGDGRYMFDVVSNYPDIVVSALLEKTAILVMTNGKSGVVHA